MGCFVLSRCPELCFKDYKGGLSLALRRLVGNEVVCSRRSFQAEFCFLFSNPTGYVFICVFVLLGSLAAFGRQIFNSNHKS